MFGFGFVEMFAELQKRLATQVRANVSLRLELSRMTNHLQREIYQAVQLRDERDSLKAENDRLRLAEKNDAIAYKAVIQRQGELRQERDDIQGRLHAIDFAYHEMSCARGEQTGLIVDQNIALTKDLEKAMETIRKQRQFIRTLYTSRHKAKKVKAKPACMHAWRFTNFPHSADMECTNCRARMIEPK